MEQAPAPERHPRGQGGSSSRRPQQPLSERHDTTGRLELSVMHIKKENAPSERLRCAWSSLKKLVSAAKKPPGTREGEHLAKLLGEAPPYIASEEHPHDYLQRLLEWGAPADASLGRCVVRGKEGMAYADMTALGAAGCFPQSWAVPLAADAVQAANRQAAPASAAIPTAIVREAPQQGGHARSQQQALPPRLAPGKPTMGQGGSSLGAAQQQEQQQQGSAEVGVMNLNKLVADKPSERLRCLLASLKRVVPSTRHKIDQLVKGRSDPMKDVLVELLGEAPQYDADRQDPFDYLRQLLEWSLPAGTSLADCITHGSGSSQPGQHIIHLAALHAAGCFPHTWVVPLEAGEVHARNRQAAPAAAADPAAMVKQALALGLPLRNQRQPASPSKGFDAISLMRKSHAAGTMSGSGTQGTAATVDQQWQQAEPAPPEQQLQQPEAAVGRTRGAAGAGVAAATAGQLRRAAGGRRAPFPAADETASEPAAAGQKAAAAAAEAAAPRAKAATTGTKRGRSSNAVQQVAVAPAAKAASAAPGAAAPAGYAGAYGFDVEDRRQQQAAAAAAAVGGDAQPGCRPGQEAEERLQGHRLVGQRIQVYWPGEKTWYTGTVDKYSGSLGPDQAPYRVRYDDGDETQEWLKAGEKGCGWRLLSEEQQQEAHQRQQARHRRQQQRQDGGKRRQTGTGQGRTGPPLKAAADAAVLQRQPDLAPEEAASQLQQQQQKQLLTGMGRHAAAEAPQHVGQDTEDEQQQGGTKRRRQNAQRGKAGAAPAAVAAAEQQRASTEAKQQQEQQQQGGGEQPQRQRQQQQQGSEDQPQWRQHAKRGKLAAAEAATAAHEHSQQHAEPPHQQQQQSQQPAKRRLAEARLLLEGGEPALLAGGRGHRAAAKRAGVGVRAALIDNPEATAEQEIAGVADRLIQPAAEAAAAAVDGAVPLPPAVAGDAATDAPAAAAAAAAARPTSRQRAKRLKVGAGSTAAAGPAGASAAAGQQQAAAVAPAEHCHWFDRPAEVAQVLNRNAREERAKWETNGREITSCHDCQEACFKWECRGGGACAKTYCVKCIELYRYVLDFGPQHPNHQLRLAFSRGACPCCLHICIRALCRRKSLKQMGAPPPEPSYSTSQQLMFVYVLAHKLLPHLEKTMQLHEQEAAAAGTCLAGVRVAEIGVVEGQRAPHSERALCNYCSTCLENLHFHCPNANCGFDLCPSCTKDERERRHGQGQAVLPAPVECPKCTSTMQPFRFLDDGQQEQLLQAKQRLDAAMGRGGGSSGSGGSSGAEADRAKQLLPGMLRYLCEGHGQQQGQQQQAVWRWVGDSDWLSRLHATAHFSAKYPPPSLRQLPAPPQPPPQRQQPQPAPQQHKQNMWWQKTLDAPQQAALPTWSQQQTGATRPLPAGSARHVFGDLPGLKPPAALQQPPPPQQQPANGGGCATCDIAPAAPQLQQNGHAQLPEQQQQLDGASVLRCGNGCGQNGWQPHAQQQVLQQQANGGSHAVLSQEECGLYQQQPVPRQEQQYMPCEQQQQQQWQQQHVAACHQQQEALLPYQQLVAPHLLPPQQQQQAGVDLAATAAGSSEGRAPRKRTPTLRAQESNQFAGQVPHSAPSYMPAAGAAAAVAAAAAAWQGGAVQAAGSDLQALPPVLLTVDEELRREVWWQNADLPETDVRHVSYRGTQDFIWTPHVEQFQPTHRHYDRTIKLFQEHWGRGEPIVVRGFSGQMGWTPEGMGRVCKESTNAKLQVVNCTDFSSGLEVTGKEFFERYKRCCGDMQDTKTGEPLSMLKLKDFPPSSGFQEVMARHHDDFLAMLSSCMPAYSHPTHGPLNLVTLLPWYTKQPDLGPKGYIAFGREKEHEGEGDSVTKMHEDLSDAVNIMLHAQHRPGQAPRPPRCGFQRPDVATYGGAGAVWDLVRREDRPRLRQFFADALEGRIPACPPFVHKGQVLQKADVHDVMHDQCFMLTERHRQLLKEPPYNVHTWHIEQYEWEAVWIPGGCPHQVRNLRSSIKVALDFVTPDVVGECMGLREEFRLNAIKELEMWQEENPGEQEEDVGSRHFADKLQVGNMVLHGMLAALGLLEAAAGGQRQLPPLPPPMERAWEPPA